LYKDIVVDSLKYCQQEKALIINRWIIMSNQVHLIARSKPDYQLADTMRDLKKCISKKIEVATGQNGFESRRDWTLWMFKRAGEKNSNNKYFQFWRQDNHPIELYGYETLKQKLNYLHENLRGAGIVYETWHYKYSSAMDYRTTIKGKKELELV